MKKNALVKLNIFHQKQFIKLAGITFAFLFVIAILALSPANAANVAKYMGRGIGGSAYSDYEAECSWNYVYLTVSEAMYKDEPGKPVSPGPMAYLEVGIDDYCISQYRWGIAEIALDTFVVGRNLESIEAEGTGTLNWVDVWCWWFPCPLPDAEEISIHLRIEGDIATINGSNTIRLYEKGKRTIIHYSGTTRLGTATGLIQGETFEAEIKPFPPEEPLPPPPGQPYPSIPYSNADFGRFNSIQISVTK